VKVLFAFEAREESVCQAAPAHPLRSAVERFIRTTTVVEPQGYSLPATFAIEPALAATGLPSPGDRLSEFAFLLDIDGTLLDIAPTPDAVIVGDALLQTLSRLQERSRAALALVSGRALDQIDRLFAPLQLPAIGGHGAEFRPIVGEPVSPPAPLDTDLRRRLAALGSIDPGIRIEDKGYALAVHYRLAPDRQQTVEAAVAAICAEATADSLEILPGKAVVEIKAGGFNKGSAVRRLMSVPPFAGRRPLFVGDDKTDETVFAVLPELGGVGFSVGSALPGVADYFEAPCDVRHWLEQLSKSDEFSAP